MFLLVGILMILIKFEHPKRKLINSLKFFSPEKNLPEFLEGCFETFLILTTNMELYQRHSYIHYSQYFTFS